MPVPKELVFFLNFLLARAFDSYYAITIPSVADQTGVSTGSVDYPVTIGSFTSTNLDSLAMIYEIKESYDEAQAGAPTVQLDGLGPSLKIRFNSWTDKFAVCVAYKDQTTGKYYGCAPFFVEPSSTDADVWNVCTNTCECTDANSCIADFNAFCDYYGWVP